MRRRAYGPAAWLIDEIDDPAGWATALRAHPDHRIGEIVPAQETVVVHCNPSVHGEVGAVLDAVRPRPSVVLDAEPVLIDVLYDGVDLASVAAQADLTIEEVIALHVKSTYRVAFCGFSPGFAYLGGLDERLQIPRRTSPRTLVPAGSVAIAAEYSSVYPSPSPGGWHLLGTTDHPVWDVDRDPPAVLLPGRTVRFRQVGT